MEISRMQKQQGGPLSSSKTGKGKKWIIVFQWVPLQKGIFFYK